MCFFTVTHPACQLMFSSPVTMVFQYSCANVQLVLTDCSNLRSLSLLAQWHITLTTFLPLFSDYHYIHLLSFFNAFFFGFIYSIFSLVGYSSLHMQVNTNATTQVRRNTRPLIVLFAFFFCFSFNFTCLITFEKNVERIIQKTDHKAAFYL